MSAYVYFTLKALLLPPGLNVLCAAGAVALRRRLPRTAHAMLLLALVSVWLLATPRCAGWLAGTVERHAPVDPQSLAQSDAQAIVILGGGRWYDAPEYGADVPSSRTLVRLRYAARLQRVTGLPIAVSGGRVFDEELSEAELMQAVLEQDFQAPARWLESESRNTAENARATRRMLAAAGIDRIVLVTEALHMRRAVQRFERAGFTVIAAPTAFYSRILQRNAASVIAPAGVLAWYSFLPEADALRVSRDALHEWLGLAWYGIRYRDG